MVNQNHEVLIVAVPYAEQLAIKQPAIRGQHHTRTHNRIGLTHIRERMNTIEQSIVGQHQIV